LRFAAWQVAWADRWDSQCGRPRDLPEVIDFFLRRNQSLFQLCVRALRHARS